jgi:heptosyltransferase-2
MQTERHKGTSTESLSNIKRLVIRAPNWLGDAVMALPAIAALRGAVPDSTLAVAAIPSVAPLFAEHTDADPEEILTLDEADHEVRILASGQFDAIVLLPNSFRSAWNARRARIPQRLGYGGNLRGPLLTTRVRPPKGRVHQSSWYSELVRSLGVTPVERVPRVAVKPHTGERAAALLAQHGIEPGSFIVGFAPGAAYGHAKRWPPSRVAETMARLVKEREATCIMVGAGADRDSGREIESLLPADPRIVNLIGRTDLRVLAGVLAACSAFVSNDSGAMHLAAAVGVPVTAIFGPTDERVTAPLGEHDVLLHQVFCRPCMLRDCPIDHRCMKGVTVDAVVASVSRHLEGTA